jgi:murein DD-endopeptidase MepM/ murein hydrolase activator NlpD
MGRCLAALAAFFTCCCVAAPAFGMTDGGPGLSLIWPADGTVTRGFGYDPSSGEEHAGIDIGTLRSLDVRAAGPGVVERVGEIEPDFDGYGNIVLVDMGDGIEALYAHLESVAARVGEVVFPGERLGEAGCTGYCTGTHLHFELRAEGVAFDPSPLLPATLAPAEGG